ncbi:putative MO25-like protein At5g47540 isoform X2 [Mangifera indica]|uniref:putative MO25-like protein At5g47540 isoform X2 n=1 Tax=Mangifera indica TaxID=29780 RepID=UPI001CFB51C9|nr:putative MO25-like protein At5g47540 isoform X2 [Mangifera indica]
MKILFKSKSKSPKASDEVVRLTRNLLVSLLSNEPDSRKRDEKIAELNKLIRDMKLTLYGSAESGPVAEACKKLTEEFFKEDTLRLLIICLPRLNLEARKDATQVVANLQRQHVDGRLIAPIYLEENLDLLESLVSGYEDPEIALHYGNMLTECIRHQIIARSVLESESFRKFFDYIQLPQFDIAADATATFKELLTRHKSTVAGFLSTNFDWFFHDYNTKLLESRNYITRRQALKLLGDILLERSNSAVMMRYVSSKDNLIILMNLLRLFAANQNKPPEIMNLLIANQDKLLRFLADFNSDKEDAQFQEDKAQVMAEIAELALQAN